LSLVGQSVTEPDAYYDNNVVGTLRLLDQMRAHGVEKIVFSGSCAVYGVPERLPLTEDHPRRPVSPYGVTKMMAEEIFKDYARAYGLSYTVLRYFNAAGADESGMIGESHAPETHLIPLVLQTIMGKRPSLTVFGDDYDTPDGTCVRDYVHVNDLARAHVAALENCFSGCLNLGTGTGFSVKQIVSACETATGKKCPVVIGEKRAGDPPALYADATRAKRILNWVPRQSALENLIDTAWRWEQHRTF